MTSESTTGVARPLSVRRRVDRTLVSVAASNSTEPRLRFAADRRAAPPSLSESSMTIGSCLDVLGVERPAGRTLVFDGGADARTFPFACEFGTTVGAGAGGGGGGGGRAYS